MKTLGLCRAKMVYRSVKLVVVELRIIGFRRLVLVLCSCAAGGHTEVRFWVGG